MNPDEVPPTPAPRTVLAALVGTAVLLEAGFALVGGWVAAAAALPALAAAAIGLACYVGGAEVLDGEHRRSLRLVRQRTLSMLGWSSLVAASRSSSGNYDHVVKPELARLYAVRLAEKYGVSMHNEPDRAAALVGPELWPWIDPRRAPAPASAKAPHQSLDRRSAAPPPPTPDWVLRALVDRLEQL